MKKVLISFAAIAMMMGFSGNAFAQGESASANATATIITPITITKNVNMQFGNVAVNTTAGTVVLTPAGTRPTITGGVTLPGSTGTVAAAAFIVTGLADATYDIHLPTSASTLTAGGTLDMTVDTWTVTAGAGTLSGVGAETFYVGGTLHVNASQPAGSYTGSFTVSVDYN